jgi:3-oxoacyl-[acyl-carrier-protein] synthase II
MTIYIQGMGNVSPQKTWGDDTSLSSPLSYAGDKLRCVEPDYNSFVDARQIRRMSRVIRMGTAAAFMAMKEAHVARPDGIITATGYGCLEDTGIFLSKMTGNEEAALNPTPFIQSTHNSIGSQIALLVQCQGYNQTYTHGAFSFENAILDAMLQLSEEPQRSLLAGGIDEITPLSHQIQSRFGIFRQQSGNSLQLFSGKEPGTVNEQMISPPSGRWLHFTSPRMQPWKRESKRLFRVQA